MKVVRITWRKDSSDTGWYDPDDLNHELLIVHSVGFLLLEDEEKVMICQSMTDYAVSETLTIPMEAVVTIIVVEALEVNDDNSSYLG